MRFLANLVLALAVLLVGVGLLEFASRVLLPIAPGTRWLGPDGAPVEIRDPTNRWRLAPNTAFVQVTADYRAQGHIGSQGYRAPVAEGDPTVLFVGDSFTFGQGLADAHTFSARFCQAAGLSCANLGHPGTGTYSHVRIVEYFLTTFDWRPREVKLFMLAYASGLASGNDFADTLTELAQRAAPASTVVALNSGEKEAPTRWGFLLERRLWLLAHSNLARIAYQQLGPYLRPMLSETAPPNLEDGIDAVATQVRELDELANKYGFRYTIYILHPMQDLILGTHGLTEAAVRKAAPQARVVATAPALLDNPRAYYFPYDGHFNAAGAERIATFLLAGEPR